MVLDIQAALAMIRDNMKKTGLPFPIKREKLVDWQNGLRIPRRRNILLYTGMLYQLMPYIEEAAKNLARLESSKAGRTAFKLAGRIRRIGGLTGLLLRPSSIDVEYSRRILKSIVALLHSAGVEFAYNPEVDGYSGVLLYDLGLDEDFAEHVSREARKIISTDAQLIITVDPHTTHILRSVYPEFYESWDLEVKSYLEILAERVDSIRWERGQFEAVTIHDPCFYARYEHIISEPRALLESAGYKVVNPRRWGRLTYCCGGPVESISPGLAKKIAEERARELTSTDSPIIATLCPICYANLRRALQDINSDRKIEDIAVLLASRLPAPQRQLFGV